jgi:hypothetical protein
VGVNTTFKSQIWTRLKIEREPFGVCGFLGFLATLSEQGAVILQTEMEKTLGSSATTTRVDPKSKVITRTTSSNANLECVQTSDPSDPSEKSSAYPNMVCSIKVLVRHSPQDFE